MDYAIEGYWLAKRRDFSANTINDYTLTFKRLTEFVGKTRELKDITGEDINRFLNHLRDDLELGQKTILNHWIALSSLWSWIEHDLGLPHIIRGKAVPSAGSPLPNLHAPGYLDRVAQAARDVTDFTRRRMLRKPCSSRGC